MRNKKGWVRIVEAFFAVMLIMAFMIGMYSKQTIKKSSEEIEKIMDIGLDEIANNNQFRDEIMKNETKNITDFLSERIPPLMNFTVVICNVTDVCNPQAYKPNTYAKERIISSSFYKYKPVKLKLFVWEKNEI